MVRLDISLRQTHQCNSTSLHHHLSKTYVLCECFYLMSLALDTTRTAVEEEGEGEGEGREEEEVETLHSSHNLLAILAGTICADFSS